MLQYSKLYAKEFSFQNKRQPPSLLPLFALSSKVRNKILSLLTTSFSLGKCWYFCLHIGVLPNEPISHFFAFTLGSLGVNLSSCTRVAMPPQTQCWSPFCWATSPWKNEPVSAILLHPSCLLSSWEAAFRLTPLWASWQCHGPQEFRQFGSCVLHFCLSPYLSIFCTKNSGVEDCTEMISM